MNRTVKLSWRAAILLRDFLQSVDGAPARSMNELLIGLQKRVPSSVKRAEKEAKKKTKKAETADIRAAVMERAGGSCEICGAHETNLSPLELHHALGRAKATQRDGNCLGICRTCHRNMTDNRPSAAGVFRIQAEVFGRLGLHGTAGLLLKRAEFVESRAALSRSAQ